MPAYTTSAQQMNERVVIQKPGGIEALQIVREPVPVPQPGQVRVRVLASGVAFGDVLLRRGIGTPAPAFPVTPGHDFAGVVDALGPGSTTYAIGAPVAGLPITGGQQTFICLPERDLIPVPPGLPPDDVVSVILNYTTAYQLLRAARLQTGDTALILGAAGGVGTAMLQLAQLQGVKLYGSVSAGKMELVRQLGGVPIDYRRSDTVSQLRAMEPAGVRAVFDPVGGAQLGRSYRMLARRGTLVLFGASSAAQAAGPPMLALVATAARFLALKVRPDTRHAVMYMIGSARKKRPGQFSQDLQTLLGLLQTGQIRPQIAGVLPLSEVRQAQQLLEAAKVTGKIILRP